MSNQALLNNLASDLRDAPDQCVIYLEGKTDVDIFFALLGHVRPSGNIHQGVLIRGLEGGEGSGSTAVTARVQLGPNLGGKVRVFGFTDGDGRSLQELATQFDLLYAGPLFSWKAYAIENLLAKSGWPAGWGQPPDWQGEIRKYSPYVGLNRIHQKLSGILDHLGIAQFTSPNSSHKLLRESDVSRKLGQGKAQLVNRDVQQDFRAEVQEFRNVLGQSLDAGHCLLNGKWLISHLAANMTGKSPDTCRAEWIAHVAATGGLTEVKDWWMRVIGKAP
jgi:hypothetical protein